MPDPGLMTKKMRLYVEGLSPSARSMLIRSMRNAQDRGEIDPSTAVVLTALTELERTLDPVGPDPSSSKVPAAPLRSSAPWGEQIRQAFFAPLQPFLYDLTYATKIPGRIQLKSLDGIWTFLSRDLAPAEFARALAAGITEANPDAVHVARKLRRDVTPAIAALVQTGDANSRDVRRLAVQLGSDMAPLDLVDIAYVFQKEGAFLNLTGQLPKTLSAFELSDSGPVVDLSRKSIDELQLDPTYVAVVLLRRCSSKAAVALLAMTLAGTTDPRLVQSSSYGRMIDTVIAETHILVHQFDHHLRDRTHRRQSLEDLQAYHDLVRQLQLTLQPQQVSAWHRQLGAARKDMSEGIAREIEPVVGLIRRALRVESTAGGFAGRFDAETADDAEFAIRLLLEARTALDSLALNELVTKLRRPVEQTIEVVTARLMTDLKAAGGTERPDLLKAIDAAIRMSALVFGEDYASILRRSRDGTLARPQKTGTS